MLISIVSLIVSELNTIIKGFILLVCVLLLYSLNIAFDMTKSVSWANIDKERKKNHIKNQSQVLRSKVNNRI